eukprot:CAMPEP_0171741390 /NCGR_PEP_ID=MMETSP0991-20121206/35523_1 /TAXON_ID=483369 /ORGANISM="non described non described, Strain CCMP2098" /LENGTH=55 /DNA_ID=CAMNT_0012339635 /DNA_START=691 /DNA_END=858 /DNA_ORIENTATION=+
MTSAIRTSAYTKRREREDFHENMKKLQKNAAQKGERTEHLLEQKAKSANDITSQM